MSKFNIFDAFAVKKKANGMLSIDVYQEIYSLAKNSINNEDILEIGTAHGACAISLALASRGKRKVITIDKIIGGSRDKFGSLEENKKIILDNFKYFDVENNIDFYVGTSAEVAKNLSKELKLSMLVIDADGAIDRDFEIFYNKLLPGCPIVIDDCLNYLKIKKDKKIYYIDQKQRLTNMLITFMEQNKLLKKDKIIDNTYFGIKPETQKNNIDFSEYDFRPIYRNLIFANAKKTSLINIIKLRVIDYVSQFTMKLSPNLYRIFRKIYKKLR